MNAFLHGEILDAEPFLRSIEGAKEIKLSINSPGGNSSAALAIWEALQGRDVEVTIHGKCYSAAVTVAMAGRVIRMHPDAVMMLHRPVNHTICDSEQMLLEAKFLGRLTDRIIGIVSDRTRNAEVERWYASGVDTYFTAAEALAAGLVDEILPATGLAKGLAKLPNHFEPIVAGEKPKTDQEILFADMLRALGEIRVASKADFLRELQVFATYNVRESDKEDL